MDPQGFKMDPLWKARYTAALRDPALQQGYGRLVQTRDDGSPCFCAYGVLVKVLAEYGIGSYVIAFDGEHQFHDPVGRSMYAIPTDVLFEIVGVPTQGMATLMFIDPDSRKLQRETITNCNDVRRLSLPAIADLVDAQW